jgi:hypothetical protein
MTYKELPSDKKSNVKVFLMKFNSLLREHDLHISEAELCYRNTPVALIEDDKKNLHLMDSDYVVCESTESEGL